MSDMAKVRKAKETRNRSLLTKFWKVTDTLRRKNNTLETENELLYESDEVDQVDIDLGRLVKKDILGHTHSVLKNSSCKSLLTQEAARVRKTLSHVNIVKFHHSFTEKSSVRCYVLETLEIAIGTFADVAQQRARKFEGVQHMEAPVPALLRVGLPAPTDCQAGPACGSLPAHCD